MKPSTFVAITSAGGLLPADFLAELLASGQYWRDTIFLACVSGWN